jgi:hypothetical protein
LRSWGEEILPNGAIAPERPIPPETWIKVEIIFGRIGTPRTCANWKVNLPYTGKTAWAGIKFCEAQFFALFPPATVKYILIQDAAKRAFEAAEELGILDLVSAVHSNQNDKLEYFLFAFLSDQRIAIFGKRSPSRNLRLISHDELKQLYPIAGKSPLRSVFAASAEKFEDVSITQTDLDQYLERLKGLRDLGTRSI